MKALVLSNLYPSSREPTRGTFNHNTFHALARYCEVRVVSPLPWWSRVRRPAEWLTVTREDSTGLDASFPTYWTVPRLGRALHGRAMYASLRPYVARLRREFAFDIILAAWAYPDAVAGAWLARDLGCPLVTKVLGSDINELTRHPSLRKQIQWGLSRSARVVAVSGALRDRIVDLGIPRDRVVVKHNGVDGEQFAQRDRKEARAQLGLSQDRPVVCYVGNFKPEKGVDVLIEAMGHLRRWGLQDIELLLVGSGEMEGPLRARIGSLQLEGQVRFCGRQLHSEIPRWISACDVFCLPSRREGCPNVVLEALASGRPVVASCVGGVPELLRQDTGVLVPPDDAAALATGLKEALERSWDPQVLRGSVPSLSWDDVGLTLRDILASALQESESRPLAAPA